MKFLGREHEIHLLEKWNQHRESCLTVVYGRRRIGKTRLIEETYEGSHLWKFEGIEGERTKVQQQRFLSQLAKLADRPEYAQLKMESWTDILILLSRVTSELFPNEPVILFFDEFQWLAAERTKLVSELKFVWDNYFQKQSLHLILCGSISSFLIKKVLQSKALYGRVHLEIPLKPLKLNEIKEVFLPKRSLREVTQIYMALGGIPQYLEMVDPARSAEANLERLCFQRTGYLVNEFERLFVSHFGMGSHFRSMLIALAKQPYATRAQLGKIAGIKTGGRISQYLEELELAGFVESYVPVDRLNATHGKRYRITDPYTRFYFKFIYPNKTKIEKSEQSKWSQFISPQAFASWQGLAFEGICYQHADLLAKKLGFSAVRYDAGPWYSKQEPAAQIDLLFLRSDSVAVICEIKFRQDKIGLGIIKEVEKKKEALNLRNPCTLETILITASPVTEDLREQRYFNEILTLEALFE